MIHESLWNDDWDFIVKTLDRIRIDRTHFWGSIDPVNPV